MAAASNAAVCEGVRRSRRTWVTACRRSIRASRPATGWRRVTSSGRYVPMSSRGPRWSAIRSNSAALSESAQCRSSKTMTAGESPIRSARMARPVCRRSTGLRRGSASAASCSSSTSGRPSMASRSTSYGRDSEPGSAWPTSTTVSAGTVASSSCTSRVFPMPGSPAMIATAGSRAEASCANRRSSLSRPIITGLAPPRMVRTTPGYRWAVRGRPGLSGPGGSGAGAGEQAPPVGLGDQLTVTVVRQNQQQCPGASTWLVSLSTADGSIVG